jgi:mono/diheme cytochrome c family protein
MIRIAMAAAMMLAAASASLAATAPPPAATLKLYKAQCASCHGLDGKGKTTIGKKNGAKDWTDGKTLKEMTDAQIKQLIRDGKKGDDGKQKMPAFKKLTEVQVDDLIKYVRSLQK